MTSFGQSVQPACEAADRRSMRRLWGRNVARGAANDRFIDPCKADPVSRNLILLTDRGTAASDVATGRIAATQEANQ